MVFKYKLTHIKMKCIAIGATLHIPEISGGSQLIIVFVQYGLNLLSALALIVHHSADRGKGDQEVCENEGKHGQMR